MIENFLNKDGKLFVFPKRKNREVVYDYLISKFEKDVVYSEKEVNEILGDSHTFNDICLLRRELFEWGYFDRSNNCAEYVRVK